MDEPKPQKPFAISMRVLLLVYAVIPFVFFLIVIDQALLRGFIRDTIGITATNAPIYVLFLELPHIIGSFISYADSEYLQFYRKRLFIRLPLLLLLTLLVVHFNVIIGFAIYLVYTMYHAVKQQTGIAGIFVAPTTRAHMLWSYMAIVFGIVGNFYVFAPQVTEYIPIRSGLFTFLAILFACLSLAYGVLLLRKKSTLLGLSYVLATSLMLIGSYTCVMAGYLFFAIFLIRFVHDTTAFIFYTVHDSNRNAEQAKNFLYKIIKPFRMPIVLITPALGIVIAYVLQQNGLTYRESAAAVILLGFTHYYIESFMWKHDSIHRRQLRFVR